MGLQDRVVLISGAASGIGLATAQAFAAEGARLALIDQDEPALKTAADMLRADGARVATACADLGTAEGVSDGVTTALAGYQQRCDVLFNNVGVCRARSFDAIDDEDWLATFEVNFLSAVRAIRIVLPGMRERRFGVIVNNSSDLARQPEAGPADYQVSKVALASLTKSLAVSEGPHVRVNALAPGPVWTPLWTRPGGFADTLGQVQGRAAREAVDHELAGRQRPLERMGEPEEVAAVAVFLASERASFVTGSVWGVDGGSIRALF